MHNMERKQVACALPDGHKGRHCSTEARENILAHARAKRKEQRKDPEFHEREREYMGKYHPEYRKRPEVILRRRELQLAQLYGITLTDYELMFAEQDGTCALCSGPPSGPGAQNGWFHVDHDAKTGKVRGLLCGNCNTALGLLKDNPDVLRAGADYLDRAGSSLSAQSNLESAR